MAEFSFVKQELNKNKRSSLLRIAILLLALFGNQILFFIIYPYLKFTIFSFLYIEEYNTRNLFYLLYWFILTPVNALVIIYFYLNQNAKYRKKFRDILFSECKLEDLYIIDHKVENNSENNLQIGKLFNLDNVKYLQSYSDASDSEVINYNRIHYRKENKNHVGMLFTIINEYDNHQFIKLSKDKYLSFDTYKEEELKMYGFNDSSPLEGYTLFTSKPQFFKTIEEKANAKAIYQFKKYFNKDVEIVLDERAYHIFIPDFKIFYTNGLLTPISYDEFEDKIDSFKTIHNLWINLYAIFKDLIVSQDVELS